MAFRPRTSLRSPLMSERWRHIADPDDARIYREAGWWSDRMLVDDVRDLAQHRGTAPAFITQDGRLSWSGYNLAADRLAGVLCGQGENPGNRVAVVLPDDPRDHIA